MLIDHTLFGVVDKVAIAIDRIKEFEPPEGYYVAFSGGKDSVTVLELVKMARVKYDAHYSLTTVDPPELVRFIKQEHPDVQRHRPEKTMWQLIVENGMPPLRLMRYCCRILKEGGGEGRRVITGIRAEESRKRAGRKMVEQCYRTGSSKVYVHPIIDWTSQDIWEFIQRNNVPYCKLYDEGFRRLGCVCCPNADQLRDAQRWPLIAEAYKRACVRAYKRGLDRGKEWRMWKSGEEMFEWWISGAPGQKQDDDQTVLFE